MYDFLLFFISFAVVLLICLLIESDPDSGKDDEFDD